MYMTGIATHNPINKNAMEYPFKEINIAARTEKTSDTVTTIIDL
jgi:hypothetical protein